MNEGYKNKLWEEIKINGPSDAIFIRDLHRYFGSKLMTFRWIKEPKIVMCTYIRQTENREGEV